jgi:hypothetical protein
MIFRGVFGAGGDLVYALWIETTMSSIHLPRDVTDYILDYLHDDPFTLMQCCLVSRSWIHGSRKHLFGQVSFNSSTLPEKWERAFPNPLNSPAFYTRRLVVNGPKVFAKASGKCDWTQAFSRVVELKIWSCTDNPRFHFPSQVLIILEPLCIAVAPLLPSHILKIVRSRPLLEDLSITGSVRDDSDDACAVSQPSTSPPLTGTFQNLWTRGIGPILRELLALPNGVRFRNIDCTWYIERDLRWVKALVDGCADTLQYVRLHRKIIGEFFIPSPFWDQLASLNQSCARGISCESDRLL